MLGGCYALILPYFCHESNFLFSRNMICQKMRNTVCLVERNPMQQEKAGNCSVTLWLWEGEDGGRVARFQSPTKVVVAQFWIFLATPWTFLWTFWGFFLILTVHWGRRSAPHLWEGLDRPHPGPIILQPWPPWLEAHSCLRRHIWLVAYALLSQIR